MSRVWHLLKRPSKKEWTTIAKVSAIGLGLIGQLTIQMLNAAGVQTIGIDILFSGVIIKTY